MRRDSVVYWLHADHPSATLRAGLGTTSLVSDKAGNKAAESRHLPNGTERWSWTGDGAFPTDYRWTGQPLAAGLGLYQMGARWYDPYINRFLSPDTIIPDFANPQSFNRYSYCVGNPVRFSDPTGHFYYDPDLDAVVWDGNPENESTLVWLQRTHPAPEGYHWGKLTGVRISEYFTPAEEDFTGAKIDDAPGIEGTGPYKEDFLYSWHGVAGQGSGLAENGKIPCVVYNDMENWDQSVWPPVLKDSSMVQFGIKERLPTPMREIAVRRGEGAIIPRGATVYIPALDVQLSDHDGFVKATDTGALGPQQIDFYAGRGRESIYGPPHFGTKSNHTIYFLAPNTGSGL